MASTMTLVQYKSIRQPIDTKEELTAYEELNVRYSQTKMTLSDFESHYTLLHFIEVCKRFNPPADPTHPEPMSIVEKNDGEDTSAGENTPDGKYTDLLSDSHAVEEKTASSIWDRTDIGINPHIIPKYYEY